MGQLNNFTSAFIALVFLVHPSLQYTHYSTEDHDCCKLIGDPDTHGPGVRISFYLNRAAAFIAVIFSMENEHKGIRRAITAVAVAVVTNTLINATKGSFANLEWYIIFNTVLFLPLPVTLPASLKALREDLIGISLLWMLAGVYMVVQPWLYFHMARQGYREVCEATIFLYAPLDLNNRHWVGFTKASAVIGAIGGAAIIVVAGCLVLYGIYDGLRKEDKADENRDNNAEGEVDAADNGIIKEITQIYRDLLREIRDNDDIEMGNIGEPRNDAELDAAAKKAVKRALWWTALCVKVGLGFGGISAIVFVENTIAIHHIDLSEAPLSETNQLTPFAIGLISFVAVVWNPVKQLWKKKDDDEGEEEQGAEEDDERDHGEQGA